MQYLSNKSRLVCSSVLLSAKITISPAYKIKNIFEVLNIYTIQTFFYKNILNVIEIYDISGQALKAIFKMNKHLYKFTSISVSHRIELFDKLILTILNYASEVWGFVHGEVIERIYYMENKNGDKHFPLSNTEMTFIFRT